MEDVRCLKQHLESTHASVHVSQDFRLHRYQTCLLAEGLSRIRRGTRVWCEQNGARTIWQQWRTFAAAPHKQRRSFADTILGQADKLASSLVPFAPHLLLIAQSACALMKWFFALRSNLLGSQGSCSRLPGGCGAVPAAGQVVADQKEKLPQSFWGFPH